MTEQDQELDRVRQALAPLVWSFLARQHREGATFCVGDMVAALYGAGVQFAPSSPDRIMRDLRARGVVDVENIDRRGSRYIVKSVRPLDWEPSDEPEQLDLLGVG